VRSLGQPVELYTARDFRSLYDSARRGDYDIAMLPAHMAALLAADDGWMPLVRTTPLSDVLVLVRSGGPIRQAADLRGRPVGMLEPLSLSAMVGTLWLQRQAWYRADLAPAVMASINSALLALLRDEVGAVVAAETQLASLQAALVARTRVLERLERIPGPIYMARPNTPPAQHQRWLAAMTGFQPDPARPTTASNVRLTPLDAADLAPLARYADLTRQRLAGPR
jgi:ABC-type phosphate/phosphonate transport system substrate-binding protein